MGPIAALVLSLCVAAGFTEAFAPTRFVWDLQTTERQLTAT
ncbi:hypothetical protein AB0M54_35735 [Actinoplanes sp. NPDC051470]